MRVAIVQRGYHGKQSAQEISKKFEVVTYHFPEQLPGIMEEVEIPPQVLNADLVISYAGHGDINLELVKNCNAVFISGKGGSKSQLRREAEKNGTRLFMEEICCTASADLGEELEFFQHFGKPELEVNLDSGQKKIEDVNVLRTAFCGATHFVAEKLKGVYVDKAPSVAGYYTQVYPCLASRGIEGKIHLAAKIHLKAVEKAINKAMSEGQSVGDNAHK